MTRYREGEFNCDCVAKANKALAAHGCHVETSLMIDPATGKSWSVLCLPVRALETVGRKRRPKPPRIIMAFCPFCGLIANRWGQRAKRKSVKT